jgi:DNA-binding NarL/FixJ family response regulator
LSSRELEVAFLVARGLSNKEVARKLNVTDGTQAL